MERCKLIVLYDLPEAWRLVRYSKIGIRSLDKGFVSLSIFQLIQENQADS